MDSAPQQLIEPLDELMAALDSLTAMLDRRPDFGSMLQTVCAHAVQVVPRADVASITLIRDGAPNTVASTDRRAAEFDQEQYRVGDGPCLRAARTGRPQNAGPGSAAKQWPEFAAAAGHHGVTSFLSVPLTVDEEVSGALNLFCFGGDEFEDFEVKLLELYTATVVFGLRSARRYLHQDEPAS
ncbi:GAF domain-containing protein [Amycolatopsis sp. H20-H5]|uniref:GAF domain-containing protein n=1 Tax=Amycolatopsis sp. H20-H5 TaxID=3046309 RepID=UPI002DBF3710|nr:GAF domain-containing protein [Amycolatopsis sp. H20-H5]MEC3981638.1 GAF domain-containing protein [Amycolatopsis sp. H20-H5]